MNSQFSSPVIKDEFLMQLPKRKVMRTPETKTGNEKLDSLLNEMLTPSYDTGTSDREPGGTGYFLMQLQPQLKQQRLRPQLSMLLQVVQERQTRLFRVRSSSDGVLNFNGT